MQPNNVVKAVEQIVLRRNLTPSEYQILLQSFQGKEYGAIAQATSYVPGYVKLVGSRLWQELSEALGQRITKRTAYKVILHYFNQNNIELPIDQPLNEDDSNQDSPNHGDKPTESDFLEENESRNVPLQTVTAVTPASHALLTGPIPLNSSFYIDRPPLETLAYQEIARPGCLLRLKAPRKYGKSSLLLRILDQAVTLGIQPIVLDFQDVDTATLENLDQLLRWVCQTISHVLNLSIQLDAIWDVDIGSKVNCKAFLQHQILSPSSTPVLLVFNEVNRLFSYPDIAQDFLPLIRSCYEQAQSSVLWQKLRLAMVYSTEIYVPLKLNQSPFNVGVSVILSPFNREQIQALAQKYGLTQLTSNQISELINLLGGHPYLHNLGFYVLSNGMLDFETFVQTAATPTSIYGPHLQQYLALLLEQPDLSAALNIVVNSGTDVELDLVLAYQLASVGLVRKNGYSVRISCSLYRDFFSYNLQSQSTFN